jgi:hypothetical protein
MFLRTSVPYPTTRNRVWFSADFGMESSVPTGAIWDVGTPVTGLSRMTTPTSFQFFRSVKSE